MGEAKRRRADKGTPARVKIRDPEEHVHLPGTLTIHVLHDSGASVTGALPLEDLDEIISTGDAIARTSGYATAREDARNYIANTIAKGEHLRDGAPQTIAALAVWLAWTAPEPQGAMMRRRLRHDHRLVLAITTHSVYGQPAINGRLMLFPPESELREILETVGLGPTTQWVTRQLAPQ